MKAHNPFFSIVIPLHNKAPHIARAIGSVLDQTFDDFELIIVDDASTDSGVEEVGKFKDSRIRLLHRSKPGPGGYAARNMGIAYARGKWVAFLDADDAWFPEHLEKMQQLGREFQDVYLLGCGWETFDGITSCRDGYFEGHQKIGNHALDTLSYLKSCLTTKRPVHTSFACVRVSSPLALNLFPEEKGAQRGGDLHAWIKLMCLHGKLAWSCHVGGVYYRDAVNMVTKTAPSFPNLMTRKIYKDLSANLDHEEKIFLKKYFNLQLREAWIGNIKRRNRNFFLPSKLYWNGDFFRSLSLSIISFVPNNVFINLLTVKKKIKFNDFWSGKC